MEKYVQLAKKLGMADAVIITPQDICFDIRAILKCRWGCEDFFHQTIKCHTRDTTYRERTKMIRRYSHILLVRSSDARALSQTILDIERAAFLDGHYFSFGIRTCNLCIACAVNENKPCPAPDKVRPCDQSFGIDVYKTVRNLGMPCNVLQNKGDVQNRYGFVLID
jgi:predicted metal-binding protein